MKNTNMKLYSAPLEGITLYPFRLTHLSMFSGIDRYFLPFVSVHSTRKMNKKEEKDLSLDHNPGEYSVPQLLTNSGEDCLPYLDRMYSMGYREINLNLGCPSGTVTAKGKGAGFLNHPDDLDAFFDLVFAHLEQYDSDVRLSVKTRIGMESSLEAQRLVQIYNRYPIAELTVHPRIGRQYYRGCPDLEVFDLFYEESHHPLVYNGDIYTLRDYCYVEKRYPELSGIMLGRGLVANPALARRIRGGKSLELEEMQTYHDALYQAWCDSLGDPNNALHRMKELWDYMSWSFEDCEKALKKIKKARRAEDYLTAVGHLFATCKLNPDRKNGISEEISGEMRHNLLQ